MTPADTTWTNAWIALGANLGNARQTLHESLDALARIANSKLCRASSLYRTAPIDSHGPDYLNATAHLQTRLPAMELLDALQAIENAAGRQRPYRNAPRTLDLDILLYGNLHTQTDRLTLPHPRMAERAFVLVPLHEIAPQLVTPEQLQAVQGQAISREADTRFPYHSACPGGQP